MSQLSILDFDTENGPGFYWYDDTTTSLLHTVSSAWVHNPGTMLTQTTKWYSKRGLQVEPLHEFRYRVEHADIVTGHNILKHDIPLLNAHMDRTGQARLKWPHVVDTMKLRQGVRGLPKSQEYLLDLFDIEAEKMRVPLSVWERAWRGEPEASAIVVERCESDVLGHIALYKALVGWDNTQG